MRLAPQIIDDNDAIPPHFLLFSGVSLSLDAPETFAVDGQRRPQKWAETAENPATGQDSDGRRKPDQRTEVSPNECVTDEGPICVGFPYSLRQDGGLLVVDGCTGCGYVVA